MIKTTSKLAGFGVFSVVICMVLIPLGCEGPSDPGVSGSSATAVSTTDDATSAGQSSKPVKGGTISTAIREWPGNLRMIGTASNTWLNYAVSDLCYQGLLTLDPDTLDYLPSLAKEWSVSDDKTTFTYEIDPRAKWSDGRPVVAADVVASWKLRMDKTILSPSSMLTYGKLNEPVAKSERVLEVTAKDKNWRNFLYFSTMSIFPAHEIGSITGTEYLDKYNYDYTAFSGPYSVNTEDIKKGESLTLTRRDDFWAFGDNNNKDKYNFDKIRFVVVTDPQLAFEKACKGEIDYYLLSKAEWWAKDLPQVPAVQKGWVIRRKFYNDAPNGTSGFAINMRHPPLDDVRVRKALQYLYDRETLIEKLAYNEYLPLDSYYQGGEYQNPKNEKIRYDPRNAVDLLAEAGWKDRGSDGILVKDGKPLRLTLTWYSPLTEKFLTSFKESCKQVGVEVVLDRTNPETMWKNLMERKFQMASMAWGALVFPNPETSMHSSLADKNDNNNITGFKSERCDELFKKYDVAFTQEERRAIVREIDGLIYEQHPYVLAWYQPCQRVMYWNKFGMPDYGFHRVLEWEDAFATWWVDPEKLKALKQARKNNTSLPIPPLENKYWLERDAALQGQAN